MSRQNLHGCSNDCSHGPTHEFVGKDKHGQDVAGAEEPCHEFSPDINMEGPGKAREGVEDGDANHGEGDRVLPTYPEEGRGTQVRGF